MTCTLRDLMVADIDGVNDGLMCWCGSNCTVNTKQCPHACTAGTRAEEQKVTASDLLRLRQRLLA